MSKKLRVFFAQVSPPSRFQLCTPPLGILYLAAYLRERFSLDIKVVNQRLEGWTTEQLIQESAHFEPDIAAFGFLTPSAYAVPELTQALRTMCPKTLIVLGGPHVTAVRESILSETSADIAIPGEGEIAFAQVLEAYIAGSGYSDIPGVIHRSPDGEVVVNPGTAPIVEDLDALPFPAYDLIDIKKYWDKPSMMHMPNRHYITMFSSRGCPYGCIYCNEIFGRHYRVHTPERMVAELKHYDKQYGMDEVEYVDDCFNLNANRVKDYSNLLLREFGPINTSFCNGVRPDLMSAEVVDALADAGMGYVGLPLETGSPRLQKLIGKNLDINKFVDAVNFCTKRRVFTNGVALFGLPTETLEEMQGTIRILSDSPLHTCSFFILTPYPNTAAYKYAMDHMPEKMSNISYRDVDFEHVRVNLSAVSTPDFTRFYDQAPRFFYGRPSRLARILRDCPKRRYLPAKGFRFLANSLRYAR